MAARRLPGLRRTGRFAADNPELARQLKSLEDNLFEIGGALLKILDGNRGVALPVREQLQFEGMLECTSTTDRNIINVIDVRPRLDELEVEIDDVRDSIVTDHGSLTGLNDPNDHTWATLVNGTRAFTGAQSMGNNHLTNVNQLVMNSSSSLLVMNGASIVGVDDITANGSGSTWNLVGGDITNVDTLRLANAGAGEIECQGGDINGVGQLVMNSSSSQIVMAGGDINGVDDITAASSDAQWNLLSGTLVNVSTVRMDDSTPAAPGGGETGVSTRDGMWRLRSPNGHTHKCGVAVYEGTAGAGSINIDVSNIDGVSYANGMFLVEATLLMTPVGSNTNEAYGERKAWYLKRDFGGTYHSVSAYEHQSTNIDGWVMDEDISMSGTTLTITRTNRFSGSNRYSIFVEITAKQKT